MTNRVRRKKEEKAPHPTPENEWIGVQKLLLEAALKKGLTFFKKNLTFFKKNLDLFQKTLDFFFGRFFILFRTSDFGRFCLVILPPIPHPADTKKGVHEGHLHRKFNQPVKAYTPWGLFQHTLDIVFGQLRDIVAHRCIALQIL